jgi:uncharacterized protein YjbI with pentapeptide repeats
MKAVKESEHGLLLNYFGLENRFYLAVTVMTFFSFDDPDAALKEQEMWPFVQGELGKDAILDGAMPKPKGEVLIWGRCFTLDAKPQVASQVGFRLGSITKSLNVFGDRFWERKGGVLVISEPRPFIEMPLAYSRAFGGTGFEQNPSGKGYAPVQLPTGEQAHPLPNIEDPLHVIGSLSDRPSPAGFGPLDQMWPQRSRKAGTYDDKWFRERWPFFPDDMDWTYFNAAPEDQQTDTFFSGEETFSLLRMNKTKPLIESRLPRLRHRVFVNQMEDLARPLGETRFVELKTRIDTVWLFPHAERGIAVSRGTVEVKDDEALDVTHIFLATEPVAEQPKSIEHYYEEFKRRQDRSVPASVETQMAEAKKKLEETAEKLKDLPLQVSDAIARGLGQAPSPARTPAEVVAETVAVIDKQTEVLAEGEKRILETRAKYGHMMKIDVSGFSRAKEQLAAAREKLLAIPAKVEKAYAQKAEAMKDAKEHIEKAFGRLDPSIRKKAEGDLAGLMVALQEPPKNLWHEEGIRFVEKCRKSLEEDPEFLAALRGLGFRQYTIHRSWLGKNGDERHFSRKGWGLEPARDNPENPDNLLIPPGLLIPRFNGPTLDKIKVRPVMDEGTAAAGKAVGKGLVINNSRDSLVDGSQESAMSFASGEGKPFIRVADELEAILLHQEIGDFCAVIAMKDPTTKPDDETAGFLKKAPQFLVVAYPQSSVPEDKNIEPWRKVFPQAEPMILPEGRSLFEAKKAGVDLWQWVADALRPDLAPDAAAKPKDVDVNVPGAVTELIPVFDVPAMIKNVRDTMMAKMKPNLDLLEAKKKEAFDILRPKMAEQGLDLDAMVKMPKASDITRSSNPYEAAKSEYAKNFAQTREQLKKRNLYTGEVQRKLEEAEKMSQDILAKSAANYEAGMAKLEEVRAKAKEGPPEWARKLMIDAHIDPDDPSPAKPLTRDEVVEYCRAGKSMARKNLSKLDLSKLDLRGVDLTQANLQKANLSEAILDGANLTQAISSEADYSKASLKEAVMTRGIFQKAKFVEAHLPRADLTKAVMSEADFTSADLTEARLEKTLLEKARFPKAKLSHAEAKQAYFLSSDVSGADFTGADLEKAVFLKAKIDGAIFAGATVRATIFIETKGEKVSFSGADMHNSRILQGSVMKESDFTGVQADTSSWMNSDLSGSDFRGTTIKRGLVENCNLAESDLTGVKARQARLTKSDLSDAKMEKIDLFQGSLRKSKLVRTNLEKANLYGVEFYRTGVGDTRFKEANLKMTKLYKRTDLLPDGDKKKK